MLQLASPSVTLGAPSPSSPLEQLHALADRELALLAHGVGDHLPIELAERVLTLRAQRAPARGQPRPRRARYSVATDRRLIPGHRAGATEMSREAPAKRVVSATLAGVGC
jgi:hypothetical protein